jgi:hypothetical protein
VPPTGLRQLSGAQLQLQPLSTPNVVSLTLYYYDDQLGSTDEASLRAFYWSDELGLWVELPVTLDPLANSVTIHNLDVSAFADGLHHVGVFGP